MPVTRSISGGGKREEKSNESSPAATTEESSSGTTATTTDGTSSSTVIPTVDVAVSPIPQVASPVAATIDAPATAAPAPTSPAAAATAASYRSKKSRAQVHYERLAVEEEILQLKLQIAKKKAARLQLVEDRSARDEDNTSHISEADPAEVNERVKSWLNESAPTAHPTPYAPIDAPATAVPTVAAKEPRKKEEWSPSQPRLPSSTPYPPPQATKSELAVLTEAITAMARHSIRPHAAELPTFSGAYQDWLAFRTAYNETARLLTNIENKARLRRCLQGRAKEAVCNLLINEDSTSGDIMKMLETTFGRAENLAIAELERLRAIPKSSNAPKDICMLSNRVKNAVTALHALKKPYFLYNHEVARAVIKKMPEPLQLAWYLHKVKAPEDEPPLTSIANFLEEAAEGCVIYADPETVDKTQDRFTTQRDRRIQRTHTARDKDRRPYEERTSHTPVTAPERRCVICDEKEHNIRDCKKFSQAVTDQRWDLAKQHRLCFRCLRYRNKTHSCRTYRCDVDGCQGTHHKLLHNKQKEAEPRIEPETVTTTWSNRKSKSFLKIVPVRVATPAGEIETWALLDDGSTVTLIDSSLANEIGARGPIDPLHIEAITEKNLNASRSRRVQITLHRNDAAVKIQARTIDQLRLSPQQVNEKDIDSCKHLRDIKGELQYSNATPRILIGQDNWHLLIAQQVRRGRRDQPVASLTPLGWVLHGAHTRALGQRVNYVYHLATIDEEMNEQLKRHFAIDNLGIEARRPASDPEQRAMKILENNTTQRADGHYEAALLWKNDATTMPNNHENAVRRLHSIERKLEKDPQLKIRYEDQMNALVSKGYAERAPVTKKEGKTWYLPHFGVINAMKPDKLRIVHDAAARTRGTSLNERLLPGPDLLQSLPGVLMRFRQHRVAVSADVSEMFMQVKIREEDRDFLRYVWRDQEYRMTSLIFGASCSPSIAIYVKNINAKKYENTHPEAAAAIVRNHYVDDYLHSYRNEEDAARIATQVRDIHRNAHFELSKWASNSQRVLDQLTEDKTTTNKQLADGANSERVLGLVWRPESDELTFNLDLARIPKETLNRTAPTKREALKIVMSLYDPLGFAAPVVIKAKQLLQEVWRRGTDWDTEIDNDLATQWRDWMTHLESLRSVSVPRCYHNYSHAVKLELHTFVDASETAYSATVYWRTTTYDGRVTLTLVTAKAKVAPLKLTSIPRLELQAAVMGSRLAATAIEEHDRKPDTKTYWTDSKTALTWIKNGSRSYKPFVAHRIAAIEEHTAVHEWRWVPTKLNIADDATRDVPTSFNSQHRWYTGPAFLLKEEKEWPTERTTTTELTGEERCMHARSADGVTAGVNVCVPGPTRISKWITYLRTTARVLQFIELCRNKKERVHYKRTKKNENKDKDWKISRDKKKGQTHTSPAAKQQQRNLINIEVSLLRRAEQIVIQAIQESCFYEEIQDLKKEKIVARNSRLHALQLRYENNIIRLNSRISSISDVTTEIAPPILDGNDMRTKLYIEYVHRQLAHAGVETTINECRQRYWILRVRPTTRTIVNECVLCRIRRSQPSRPSTGNHPSSRLAHHRRSFTYAAVDYFGPLTVTVGRSQQKRYVALFTCLTTRAVHLEMAATLSTDSAIMALRRMIARRGCPTEIWSDNGTNLRGADRELRRAIDEATQEEAEKKMISWRYIPPSAPFMGGAWERLVRSVKAALAATQQCRHPNEEVLATLLAEAEYTVNSRPLTHVSVHHEDDEALTPNHFLLGGSALTPAPGTFSDADLIGRANWRASQRLADIFWTRWLREYLPELQHRREPHSKGLSLKTGDVVLIVDNTLPRNTWPRGVVTATFPGADGVVRVADVKTQGGTLRRPTKKLVIILPRPAVPSPSADCSVTRTDVHGGRNVQNGQIDKSIIICT